MEPVAVGESMPDMPLFLIEGGHVDVPLEQTYAETWNKVPQQIQRIIETGIIPEWDGDDE